MALSALRRTLDDTHDQVRGPASETSPRRRGGGTPSTLSLSTQDGDVPSERRAIRALEEAEALCRRMRRAKSADDGERGALMRATRACERLVEKVESAKLRTVRVKERRRQFSLLPVSYTHLTLPTICSV